MKMHVGKTIFRLLISLLLFTMIACGGSRQLSAPQPVTSTSTVIEDDLVSTTPESDEPIVKNGVTYEAPQKKIKNAQAEILLDRAKMERTKIIYDKATHEMKISGSVHIVDENKKNIGHTEFEISGSHSTEKNEILLKAVKGLKINSMEKPFVRAKVTCLSVNEKDEYDCSHSVVDFFVAFKKQIYSKQMELVQKLKSSLPPDIPPTNSTPAKKDPPVAPGSGSVAFSDDLQPEGQEDSIEGRYQGHAETADLTKVFDGDATPEITFTPAPAVPTPSTPTPPVAAEKKEKQLTKDLQQLKNGDVRQINQAIGFPDNGNLRNATSLLTKQQALNNQAFFEIVHPGRNRHYGTYEVAEIISRMGKKFAEESNHKLYIGNISQKAGGKVYSLDNNGKIIYDKYGNPVLAHASHQAGVDVDVAYPTTDVKVKFPVVFDSRKEQFNSSIFSVEQTFDILKFAFNQPDIKIDRIFMDRTIKKALCDYAKSKNEFNSSQKDLVNTIFNSIDHVSGHGDHFHLRLKCSSYDPGCRQKLYSVNKGCN